MSQTPAAKVPDAAVTPASPRRILTASLVGTAVEFYDFYIYATAAALVFGALFFPSDDKLFSTMAAFGTFAVGFFARPLGACSPAINTAPPHSPPTAMPWTMRSRISSTGAVAPICA